MEQKAYLYKKIAYLYKEKTQKKRPSPMTTDKKLSFSSKKKRAQGPVQNLERKFSHHPQVAMSCMSQSNLIDRGNCQLSLYS